MGTQQVLSELEYDNQLVAKYFDHLIDSIGPDIIHFFHFSRLGTGLIDVAVRRCVSAYYTPTDFWSVCPTSQLVLPDGRMCSGPSAHSGNCIRHISMLSGNPPWERVARCVPSSAASLIALLAKSNIKARFPLREEIAALSKRMPFNISRLNSLQGIVSPTRLMTDLLRENGVDENLIVQCSFGLDISEFQAATRQFDRTRPLNIGFVGTLSPHKGCHVLIQALRLLRESRCTLQIYGCLTDFPDYVDRLRELAGYDDRIEFRGTFPNGNIATVLSDIDVLVVPSLWYENTPLVVYSAMAAKCPVVASDFPGLSEIVHDEWNGLTFKPKSPAALAKCLDRLMIEPNLLSALSANCEMPKSISKYVEELLVLYQEPNSQCARGKSSSKLTSGSSL